MLGSAEAQLRGERLVSNSGEVSLNAGGSSAVYELCSASLLQSRKRSWPISLTGAGGGSIFKLPFAVLATIDCKAQKESFFFFSFFLLLLKTGLKALLLLVLSA